MNKGKKALVLVDMLNDFVKEDGLLPVNGAEGMVSDIKQLYNAFKEKQQVVVYANDAHSEDDVEFENWPTHCVKGTYGAEIVDGLKPQANDVLIEKQDLNFFTNQKADSMLRENGIDEIYLVGVATDYCVRAAAIGGTDKYVDFVEGAVQRGYKVNLVVDCVRGVDEITLPNGASVPGTRGKVAYSVAEMTQAGVNSVYGASVLEELAELGPEAVYLASEMEE